MKIIPAVLKGARNVLLCQRLCKHGRAASGGTHENDNVLRAARPQRALLPGNGIALVQKLTDTPRREACLGQQLFDGAGLLLGALVRGNEMELRIAVRPLRVISRSKVKHLILSVFHLTHFGGENVGKHEIRCVQNFLP